MSLWNDQSPQMLALAAAVEANPKSAVITLPSGNDLVDHAATLGGTRTPVSVLELSPRYPWIDAVGALYAFNASRWEIRPLALGHPSSLRVPSFWQSVATGTILVLAVAVDSLAAKSSRNQGQQARSSFRTGHNTCKIRPNVLYLCHRTCGQRRHRRACPSPRFIRSLPVKGNGNGDQSHLFADRAGNGNRPQTHPVG